MRRIIPYSELVRTPEQRAARERALESISASMASQRRSLDRLLSGDRLVIRRVDGRNVRRGKTDSTSEEA